MTGLVRVSAVGQERSSPIDLTCYTEQRVPDVRYVFRSVCYTSFFCVLTA